MKWIKIAVSTPTVSFAVARKLSVGVCASLRKRELQIGILNVFITAKWVWLLYL
ncbi:MAG: hypothetical protein WC496_05050 [Phycisphaerae bacterium]|jgi:hypothetical protein